MRFLGPQDNGNLLTTDTDLAYQKAIKGSRTGPFIMGECLDWEVIPSFAYPVDQVYLPRNLRSWAARTTGSNSATLCGSTDGSKPSRRSNQTS